ncbi:hypothetical protein [Mycolicibacter arupensis]|jgi:hypothetical protein|uniref:Uncharacterized protein n=1 Tax=Mycolicibacter arupensis TaxID=342002 RepID=A0A5C7Y1T5_9MYCO|nr:hypothetical protein [Mycolicibacter arupensis]TXI55581.1 MAG: hypothetical protein E6Q54_12315 [Mycolicibacter arupensis]
MYEFETAAELSDGMSGVWLVTTGNGQYVWDLNEQTWAELVGEPTRTIRCAMYPAVGMYSLVWFEPHDADARLWYLSDRVTSIKRLR